MVGMFKYLTGILEKEEKRDCKVLAVLSFISAVVNVFSFSVTIYFIVAIRDKYALAGVLQTSVEMLILFTALTELSSIANSFFDLYSCKVSSRFIHNGAQKLSMKVFELFTNENLGCHNEKSGMQALAMVRSDTTNCIGIITVCIGVWKNCFVLAGYIIILIYVSKWVGVLTSIMIIILTLGIFCWYRSQMKVYGEKVRKYDIKANTQVMLTYGMFEEMKIGNYGTTILERYRDISDKYAQTRSDSNYKSGMISLILKLSVKAVMLTVFVLLFLSKVELATVLVPMAAYISALNRIVPVAYSIINGMNSLEFSKKPYETLKENLVRYMEMKKREMQHEKIRKKKLTFRKGLTIRNLTFSYNEQIKIFQEADMEVPVGHSVAVIGVSGVGKTTLLALVMGLLEPQEGYILYDDYDIVNGKDAEGECRASLGDIVSYIPQIVYMNGETVRHNVAFFEKEEDIDDKKIIECLQCAQVWEDVKRMSDGLATLIGEEGVTISGGQRQRIALARALYKDFELLIMDEATAALNMEMEKAVIDSIKQVKENKTILLVTHHMSLAHECDIIYKIENQKIVRIK